MFDYSKVADQLDEMAKAGTTINFAVSPMTCLVILDAIYWALNCRRVPDGNREILLRLASHLQADLFEPGSPGWNMVNKEAKRVEAMPIERLIPSPN